MRLFGEVLREARLRAGFSQRRLARASGRTQQWISELEQGEKGGRLTREHALQFARALGLADDSDTTRELIDATGRVAARDEEQTVLRHRFLSDTEFRRTVRGLLYGSPPEGEGRP